MGIFDWLFGKRINKDILRKERRKKSIEDFNENKKIAEEEIAEYDVKNNNGLNEEYVDSKQGKILHKKYFKKNGRLHGKYYEYKWEENNHWIQKEINYSEGKKHGVTKYFWKKHISAEGKYKNDKLIGEIKKYFRFRDELSDTDFHHVVNELADLEKGVYKVFSLDGKCLENSIIDGVVFKEGISSSKNGYSGAIYPIRNGLCEKWFENGKLKESGYWKKGIKVTSSPLPLGDLSYRKGKHIHFYENGNKFKEGKWIENYPVGLHKIYYPNGSIQFEVEYFSQESINNLKYQLGINKELINREKWYNEDGSLMNIDQIIEKAGSFRMKPTNNTRVAISGHESNMRKLNLVTINDMNFSRRGVIYFYQSYYTTLFSLGHSYKFLSQEFKR